MPRRNDPDLTATIGLRLAELRKRRGWSQERLAEATGLEALTLSRAEAGARALGLANLARVAVVLECSLGDLIDEGRAVPVTEQPPEEAELVQHYRRLDEAGRKTVLAVVREIGRAWPGKTRVG